MFSFAREVGWFVTFSSHEVVVRSIMATQPSPRCHSKQRHWEVPNGAKFGDLRVVGLAQLIHKYTVFQGFSAVKTRLRPRSVATSPNSFLSAA